MKSRAGEFQVPVDPLSVENVQGFDSPALESVILTATISAPAVAGVIELPSMTSGDAVCVVCTTGDGVVTSKGGVVSTPLKESRKPISACALVKDSEPSDPEALFLCAKNSDPPSELAQS